MINKNIKKIVSQVLNNLSLTQYFSNYNKWLKQKLDDADAGVLEFDCTMTIKFYKDQAEKSSTLIDDV